VSPRWLQYYVNAKYQAGPRSVAVQQYTYINHLVDS
jgi:hypothetical protein